MVEVETVATSAVVSLFVSVVASVAAFEYRFRREQTHEGKKEIEQWYAETAELSHRIQQTWQRKYKRPSEMGGFTNHDEVRKEMCLLESQITGHVAESQDLDVDSGIVEGLEQAANHCRDIQDTQIYVGEDGLDDFDEAGKKLTEEASELQEQSLDQIS